MFRQATVRVSSRAKWIASAIASARPADAGELVEEDPDCVKELAHVLRKLARMEPLYHPQGVEERWQRTWEEEGLYNAEPGTGRETFVVAHPPPNVTGALHTGHALQISLADALVRWHRMRGFETAFLTGYDHAGISTQNAVEKQLVAAGQDAAGLRARGVRRARLGLAPRVRRHDHGPVPPHRRLDGLPARALHDGRRVRPRR